MNTCKHNPCCDDPARCVWRDADAKEAAMTDLRKAAEALERARSAVSRMRYDESPEEKARLLTERDEALDAFHAASGETAAILALYADLDAANARAEKAEKDLKASSVNLAAVSLMVRNERSSLAAVTAKRDALRGALDSIDIYGSDTLSGNATGPNNAKWYLDGVRVMRDRAREALKEPTNAER